MRRIGFFKKQPSEADFSYLCRLLKDNPNLTCLSLRENQIPEDYIVQLCEMLKENTTLRSLKLDGNKLSQQSILKLSELLISNKSLRNLSLKSTHLQDQDIPNLIQALIANDKVNRLDLSWNALSKHSIILLCSELAKKTQNLHCLDLCGNQLSDVEIKSLCTVFENTNLHYVKLQFFRPISRECWPPSNEPKQLDPYKLLRLECGLANNREKYNHPLRMALMLLSYLTDPKGIGGTFPMLPLDVLKIIIMESLPSGKSHQYKNHYINNCRAFVESILMAGGHPKEERANLANQPK